jgi:hypothetical protein
MMTYRTLLRTLLGCVLAVACDGAPAMPVPASIAVSAAPMRLYYHSGQEITLRGDVLDGLGEEIEDVEVRWTVDPVDGATDASLGSDPRETDFTLGLAPSVTFTGCVGDELTGAVLCDSITLRVDDGMPSLEVEAPLPGAELDDPAGIVVRGSVADRNMVNVYANGVLAEVDDMGRFELALPPQLGVNHLIVDASDGVTEASQVEMDVLWAPAYTPALGEDGQPSLTYDDGIALWLGQGFFDDEVPFDPSTAATRDLADIVELVITNLDVTGLVPDPVIDSPPTFTMRVTSVELGAPHAEIDVTDDGADVFVRIGELRANTEGFLVVEDTSLPLTGTVTASAIAYAHLVVTKETEESPLEVTVADDFTVGIETMDGTFVSEETAAVFRLASGILRTTLEDAFRDAVRSTVESSVPAILRDALTSVDGALADRTIPLAVEPFPAITIEIDGRIRSIDSVFRREMLATMRTTIGTDTMSVHPESRGVARWDASAMTPDFFRGGSLALGVRTSLLNGLLHSLWASGLLAIDVTPLLPEGVSGLVTDVRLTGRLPPVLRPPRAGETDALVLSLGQLELDMMFMGAPVRFAISLDAGVAITVVDNQISILIAEEPRLVIWTLIPPENERVLTEDTVRMLLLDLWPDLRESVQGGLTFELPLPGLGDLGGLAPALSTFTLTLESIAPIRPRGDVLVLDAALIGGFPP